MQDQRRRVVYILAQIDRIGQLAGEMFYLRNLYEESEFDLTVVTYPPELMPRTNQATYRIATRDIDVRHSIDDRLIWFTHSHRGTDKIGIFEKSEAIYYLLPPDNIAPDFMKKYRRREPQHPFRLTDEELSEGLKLRENFGIPREAPIVTIHVREGGYLPHLNYHSYRDSNIENYIPAIEYLIERGYYVIRIGDPSMKKVNALSASFIDAPFHPSYTNLVEPYFISQSEFFISTGSGPHALAQGFGIPVLQTNQPILAAIWGEKNDLIIHKNYYSRKDRRLLSYEQVLLSEAADFYEAERYWEAELELRENSPEEICAAVKEMSERLNATYAEVAEAQEFDTRVQAIRKRADEFRAEHCQDTPYPFLPCYWHNVRLSHDFAKLNPHLLGD